MEAIEECCDYAGSRGVFLALENHGGLTSEIDGLLQLIRDVKSPWFGINFDSGNFNSEDPYADLEKIAPYAVTVQLKIDIQPAGKPSQPADFRRLAKILGDAGYRGYITLEYEDPRDPRTECPRYLEQIREAFA